MAGDGGEVDVAFGEQRRGENLGTRAGLGKQGRYWYWYVLLVYRPGEYDLSLEGEMGQWSGGHRRRHDKGRSGHS